MLFSFVYFLRVKQCQMKVSLLDRLLLYPKVSVLLTGIKDSCSADNFILNLFKTTKLAISTANNPERAIKTACGYLSKVIAFVEALIPEEERVDKWDFLRFPEYHRAFLDALSKTGLIGAGKENYRKHVVMAVLTWSGHVGKQPDTGRWVTRPDFPDDRDFEHKITAIRVMYADFGNQTGEAGPSQRRDKVESLDFTL